MSKYEVSLLNISDHFILTPFQQYTSVRCPKRGGVMIVISVNQPKDIRMEVRKKNGR